MALIVFSPVVSGKPVSPTTHKTDSMLHCVEFHWFPLDDPGIVSIPLPLLLGYFGSFARKAPTGRSSWRWRFGH
jgi:cation/acetate symporter